MGFKGNVGSFRLLRTLGALSQRNFLDRSSGSLWGLHGRLNFLHRGFISSYIFSRRSSGSIPFWVLVVTSKKAKGKRFLHNSKGGKQVKKSIELAKYLRVQEVEKFYSPF
jgi:hypothetical protein